jgi:RNA polymerase sigma factor (sigma-70 family)
VGFSQLAASGGNWGGIALRIGLIYIKKSLMADESFQRTKELIAEAAVFIQNSLEKRFPEINWQDKEDIVHEIQLKLWKLILRKKKIINFRAYLSKIIYTTALDIIKNKMPYLSVEEMVRKSEKSQFFSEEALNSNQEISPETKLIIDEALASLPERKRAVFMLYLEGFSLKEMAAKLHWTTHQVRHLLYRTLDDLRRNWGKNKNKPKR